MILRNITTVFFIAIISQKALSLNDAVRSGIPYSLPTSDCISDHLSFEKSSPDFIERIPLIFFKYGILLDIPVETVSNLPLYSFIDDWIGTPYRYGGQDKTGIDCSSFTMTLLREIYEISLPRTSYEQYNTTFPVMEDDLCEGDLLFFKTGNAAVSHVGIYLGNGKFVHASTTKGVTIDSIDMPYYSKTYVGAGRMIQFH